MSVAGCALLLLLVATCHVDKITNNPPPVATLGVAPAKLTLAAQLSDSLTRQSCAAPHRPGSFAQLYSFTGRAGDSVSIVMSAPALDGYVVFDTATTGDAPSLAENDQCAAGTGACLLYQLL